jgi:hypothetical protein
MPMRIESHAEIARRIDFNPPGFDPLKRDLDTAFELG